ncbi:Octicosapeptide/Phox/Bem1p family protein, putative isoform 2 [Hibiscus syriacus]|uniref:Octicosapeptide/Phox/Bem1p family protein, putative isoform 2 n=1 Tax=Hibiscus syriacus TaxID=106335 RepID=A0A6A2YG12_HIBSY|nr:class E vacuolar protein-sorting machinery protein HSE1-like [Hibiscus syriacus]KAE8672794.1 Octicosapeptide/Phox/Bem1p family protein, putative isoform 2 [Hibiscus syriacus]
MENYSYNSYPDSGESSPRSREIDFENPHPWEDQPQHAQNYKAKFMCSYGGKIHPRTHDNLLAYIGGETKILAVDRTIKFSSMVSKLSALCGGGDGEVSFKYQLTGEDLDALISVTNDDDLEHMMHEYDRLYRASAKPVRMRLFIFPPTGLASFGSEEAKSERDLFVEALNSGPTPGVEKHAAVQTNNMDYLFGLEKGMPPSSPVRIVDPAADPVNAPPTLEAVAADHGLNPADFQRQLQEMQRLQIRDQEQLAMYRKMAEDAASMAYSGEYYAQKLPEKAPPVNVPVNFQQHVPATGGFWSDKPISAGVFPETVTSNPGPPPPSEHPVYMISAQGSAPGTVYHVPPPVSAPAPGAPPPHMGRPVPGQGYYTNVQRMAHPHEFYREQPVYNMVAQPPPAQQHPPISGMTQQMVRPQSGGVSPDAAYAHMAAYDRQVYYTAPGGGVVPPQYQGVGMAVSGETRSGGEAKLPNKLTQGSV